jgi:hypothetical protein
LSSLNNILINKEYDLKVYQTKNNIGLSIDNFVNTFNFNNVMLKEKIILFITYLEFFHKLHNKYFKRFTTKLQLMYSQITHDIKFEDNDESKKNKNTDMLNALRDEEVGKNILKELKASINDNNEFENGSEFEMIDKLTTPRSISQDYEDVLNKFQSGTIQRVSVHETSAREDANIILEVIENIAQRLENEKITAPINNSLVLNNSNSIITTNEDDLSIVTMESTSGGSNETNSNNSEKTAEDSSAVKKKRTYKPRKKKETPQEN